MSTYTVHLLPADRVLTVPAGETLLRALQLEELHIDAPCGGNGTCQKCKVLLDGTEILACRQTVDRDMTVTLLSPSQGSILTAGLSVPLEPDGENVCALAFDIGTTTVVCYLLDGITGETLAQASCLNPQSRYGADVVSRLQHARHDRENALQSAILDALAQLTRQVSAAAGVAPTDISLAAIVGNTAMHHLLLNIDPKPLTTPPYMPTLSEALELPAKGLLPISETGVLRILPNIAGFVGADTVGCLVATRFDRLEKPTLMIDIGTNGEMVLGDKNGFLVCSTAAGPAFEGAKLSCGMRGTVGAVDHVWLENGELTYHVIGETAPVGLCGSGVLDLVAMLLDTGDILGTGRMPRKQFQLHDSPVVLTQQDVREVQLAKGAIQAGIELMCQHAGYQPEDIDRVLLAGAFGNYLDPHSACRIGMIPPCLEDRIQPIGNAAGVGAKLCAVSRREYEYSQVLAAKAEFLELASLPQFQDRYVDALNLEVDDDD